MYLSIVRWGADNYVDKYQECATQEEANAHVASVAETFPNAFSSVRPAGGPKDWLVDPAAKTVSYVLRGPTEEEIAALNLNKLMRSDSKMPRVSEDIWDALVLKGVLLATDLPQAAQDSLTERKALRKALE